jgi:hypothetical protein
MVSLIDELGQHDYHGAKLKEFLKEIAKLVEFMTPFRCFQCTDFYL